VAIVQIVQRVSIETPIPEFISALNVWYTTAMNVITIPRRIAGSDDLVVVSRKEYESLKARAVPEFVPTKAEIRALRAAEKRFAKGKFYSLADVKRDLESRR